MTEEHTVAQSEDLFQVGSSAAKSSVVSPPSSPDNSISSSPSEAAHLSGENEADSDRLSDSRDEGIMAPQLAPVISQTCQPNDTSFNFSPESSHQGSDLPRKVGGVIVASVLPATSQSRPPPTLSITRRPSFGLGFLSSLSNTIRGSRHSHTSNLPTEPHPHNTMSNSPTLANINNYAGTEGDIESLLIGNLMARSRNARTSNVSVDSPFISRENTTVEASDVTCIADIEKTTPSSEKDTENNGMDKDGNFFVRLTPIIDHSSSNSGLYFSPIIRRIKPKQPISIGRYTEKHKSAAQRSSSRVVFKSKVVSRTHAMLECSEDGLWFIKDCKSSSGTFLNNIRLSHASQELTLWPLIDGDIVQLGLDYRGGTEEVYRCVKMRCEFNRSWQRKVNRYDLAIHKRMKKLGIEATNENRDGFSECAICLLKLEPCQALFISPCSHAWHYKCIRPIIIKRYPQFHCPNCRSICDLETDIEDEEDEA